MKKLLIPAAVVVGVVIATISLVVYPLITPPRFITLNLTDEPVFLAADWRGQSMSVGQIEPRKTLEFRLNDEPPITLEAEFPGGKRVRSKLIFYSRGEVVHAQVSRSGIEVVPESST